MITPNGVCYDLKNTPYKHQINGLTFLFSSQTHKDKFIERLDEHRKKINDSLSNRFNIYVDVSELSDVILYKKIETRGFLIESENGVMKCLNNVKFTGANVTIRKYKE